MDLIKCRKCSQRVWANHRVCPECGTRLPLNLRVWSFVHGEGKGEVIGVVVALAGMGVGWYGYDRAGGIAGSIGVAVFFAARFTRRIRERLDSVRPGRD